MTTTPETAPVRSATGLPPSAVEPRLRDGSTTASSTAAPAGADYGADQIKILEGLDAVRKRPGMYIGDTGQGGLHHLVFEAVDNSIDECMAGRATFVAVRIHADGSLSVTDDGSGIPVDPKKHDNPLYDGKPAIELVMTLLHAGGKFGEEGSAYKVSGGLHGVGISCVNALSEYLVAEVYRGGMVHQIRFERGKTAIQLRNLGPIPPGADRKTGTKVTFKPDPLIFPETDFNYSILSTRLRELAYLNPGVTIRITDERVAPDGSIRDETFRSTAGLAEFVAHLGHAKAPLSEVVALKGEDAAHHFSVEVALQYNDSYNEVLLSFANNIRTVDGGTHLSGFKSALTRTLNAYARQAGLIKDKDPVPTGEDLREGLIAIISAKLPEPQFEGQTKGKLRNTDVEGFVSQIVGERLENYLQEHPAEAKRICQKGLLAAQAREAARKARDLTRRKSALESGSMPHKLRDCTTKDVDRSEMFIVEGDSAGGSATQGRDVETQAILPLRGKLLNVEKARLDKILAFEEIRTLISALRCGIGEDFDASKLRYGRIIIMTDADVDGSHIRTLLLTFFFRQMPELIRRGRIFIAQPPLYQIVRNKKSQYVLNEHRMSDVLAELGLEGASLLVRDNPADGAAGARAIEGDALKRAVRLLRRLTELVEISQRRGVRFTDLLAARDADPAGQRRLPSHRLTWPGGEAFAWGEAHAAELLRARGLHRADAEAPADATASRTPDPRAANVRELHENRELQSLFVSLSELGLRIEDWGLSQEEAVTGEKIATRYAWRAKVRGGTKKKQTAREIEAREPEEAEEASPETAQGSDESEAVAPGAPAATTATGEGGYAVIEAPGIDTILSTLLDLGRRGMEIKRFKGLGEMDPAQLWETTMDSSRRTLLRVNWDDASAADELFTILMGEDVDQRRKYIEQHALDVKQLDV